jgi:nicotinate-nucleotide pyrophosphorylase (carboxylating)
MLYFCLMYYPDIYEEQVNELIKNALAEDLGDGDHSSLACIVPGTHGKAILKIKEKGILAGMTVAEKIFAYSDMSSVIKKFKQDGELMQPGEIAFEVEAKIYDILTCERLVLNCMQRMCGIATLTRKYVDKLKDYHTKLLDTRKTTPNFRILEKEAVRIGGGFNHRFGLYDMILLKDNHIAYCGGIEQAITNAWLYVQKYKPGLKIEVETRNIEDVEKVLRTGRVNRIMFDNFSPQQVTEALSIINGRYETEASGGINYENIESYAATGVDFISSGAIIHQARSLDLSLKAEIIQ